jgi:hypothetical protein
MYDTDLEVRVDREIAGFLEQEHAAKGNALYPWYRLKFIAAKNAALSATIGLAPYDRAIARFVVEQCSFATRFVEVGAGIGQESMLLALQGVPTYAIEWLADHIDMMTRLRRRLAERIDRTLPDRMTPVHDWFPKCADSYVDEGTLLAFPTLSTRIDEELEREIFHAMQRAAGVILSLKDFFRHRPDPADQDALVARIRDHGFDAPVIVRAWEEIDLGFPPDRIVFMKRLR